MTRAEPVGAVDLRRLDDGSLMAAVVRRDQRAFEALHGRHRTVALGVARAVLGTDRHRAEDVVQEAFVIVWRDSALYDPSRGSVRTWLAGIVRHRAIDLLRRDSVERRREMRIKETSPRLLEAEPTARALEESHTQRAVRRAVERLPRDQYRVIDLSYYLGLPQTAIAETVRCPLGTVKGRSRLALDRLRDLLQEEFDRPLQEGVS